MKRLVSARQIVIGAGVVVMLVLGAVVVRIVQHQFQTARQAKAVYYCPMHPTYTSDRPGDCPICNMRLVKRQVTSAESKPRKGKAFADICYLHNCPKVHEGRPCPMLVVAKEGEKVTCPICGTHVAEAATPPAKKILYWTDPMLPGYKSDKPGKSPMGMDLVPVYEEEAPRAQASVASPEGYAPILVTPQKQQLIGVITAPAQRRVVTKTIRTVGRVMVDETRMVVVP
jgi:Cu(I)/Ag(I) efflux system membrane fusion protein/cobalt-zinc-cadmium efflux system membrane fusion protein